MIRPIKSIDLFTIHRRHLLIFIASHEILKSFARELHTLFRIFVDQDELLPTHAFPAFVV